METLHISRAPGQADRNGISLPEFFRRFPDHMAAEAWVESVRWPNDLACIHCGSLRVLRVKSRKPMPPRCKDCRSHFSVKYGTIMTITSAIEEAMAEAGITIHMVTRKRLYSR